MATKKKATKKKATKKIKAISVAITPDNDGVSERIYSNYCDVLYSPHDCTLRFCDVPPIRAVGPEPETDVFIHKAPVVSEVAIPHEMVPNLVKALQSQRKQFIKNYESGNNGSKPKSK